MSPVSSNIQLWQDTCRTNWDGIGRKIASVIYLVCGLHHLQENWRFHSIYLMWIKVFLGGSKWTDVIFHSYATLFRLSLFFSFTGAILNRKRSSPQVTVTSSFLRRPSPFFSSSSSSSVFYFFKTTMDYKYKKGSHEERTRRTWMVSKTVCLDQCETTSMNQPRLSNLYIVLSCYLCTVHVETVGCDLNEWNILEIHSLQIWIHIKASNRWPFNCPNNEVATGGASRFDSFGGRAPHFLFILIVSIDMTLCTVSWPIVSICTCP
jgi:hypothetical protein